MPRNGTSTSAKSRRRSRRSASRPRSTTSRASSHRLGVRRQAMSTLGLEVFDRTFQTTNVWLDEIMDKLGPDRQIAWKVLSTVLHKLRDMLQPDLAAHLGAQLPLLVRGVFYDLYEPSNQPTSLRTRED